MSHIVINLGFLPLNGLSGHIFGEMSDKDEIKKLRKLLKSKDKYISKLEAENMKLATKLNKRSLKCAICAKLLANKQSLM